METGPWIQLKQQEGGRGGGHWPGQPVTRQPQLARIFQRYQRQTSSPYLPLAPGGRVPPEAAAAVPALLPEYSAVLPAQPQLDSPLSPLRTRPVRPCVPFGSHAKIRNRRGLPAIFLLVLSSLNATRSTFCRSR